MHTHMVFACHILTPPSHRTPTAPRALSFLLEIVMNNGTRVAGHGKALLSSVKESIGI